MKTFRRKKQTKQNETSRRITNETVAEHRERILAGGRRFKYPVQYARHRLVINTIIISIVTLVVLMVVFWWQLYQQQNSSTLFYRVTRVVPLPVAVIDGERISYSNYLMGFRSQEHYLRYKEGVELHSKDNQQQLNYYKRKALDDAVADGYAAKIAREKGVSVSKEQVDQAMKRQRQSRDGETSQEAYDAIVLDHYNWTPAEAREVTERRLLYQEVAYHIDTLAIQQREQVAEALKTEQDFDNIAESIPAKGQARVQAGVTPLVPRNNQDGGLAVTAANQDIGVISEAVRSTTGDGYYFVKTLEKDETKVSYAYLKVPLTMLDAQLQQKRQEGSYREFISVEKIASPLVPVK